MYLWQGTLSWLYLWERMVDGVGGVVGRINGGGCRFCYPDINWKQHRTETLFLTEGPASFPGPTQPHSRAPPSLIPRPHPASFPGPTQPHSQAPPSLIPRPHPASFPGPTQPHSLVPPSFHTACSNVVMFPCFPASEQEDVYHRERYLFFM